MRKIDYHRKTTTLAWWWYAVAAICVINLLVYGGSWIRNSYLLMLIILFFIEYFTSGYSVRDGKLFIYDLISSDSFPIDKISGISYDRQRRWYKPFPRTKLKITFNDRSILKSTMPLVVIPTDCQSLVKELLNENPSINVQTRTLNDTLCPKQ